MLQELIHWWESWPLKDNNGLNLLPCNRGFRTSSHICHMASAHSHGSWYRQNVMLLIFSRELLHTTKMGSQLTGPLSSCWNSTALTPGLSLVYKISFPCLYFYIATWSFDNRYISAGKHLIHKMFTLYTVFPLWSWWLAWKALNCVTYRIFLSGLDARGVPVITFHIDDNLRNIP